MIRIENIHSLTDFQRNTKAHLKRLKKTGQPEVLTHNGKAAVVVQDAKAYEAMLEQIDRLEASEGVRQGLEEIEKGEYMSLDEFVAETRTRYGIKKEL